MLENIEGAIKNKHPYAQVNTNNVNKT